MANADVTAGSAQEAFRARMPVFKAVTDSNGASRVVVTDIVDSQAPAQKRFAPDHPQSDADGYIYMPNVNIIEQMTDMISASRSYQANLEVMTTNKELMMQTLQLGQGR